MHLTQFRVQNYRSVRSTDWIDVTSITAFVGQNESGKSNLCEALFRINPYVPANYVVDEDWPVDDWGKKDPRGLVCEARFTLTDASEITTLLDETGLLQPAATAPAEPGATNATAAETAPAQAGFTRSALPTSLVLKVSKFYDNKAIVRA